MAIPEKYLIKNTVLSELIDNNFLEKVRKLGYDINPVTLVLMKEEEVNGKKRAVPIIISHNSKDEIDNKTIHIESPDIKILEEINKILES